MAPQSDPHFRAGEVRHPYILCLFFLRSWRQSADRLFLFFGLAFWMMSVENTLLASMRENGEAHWGVYVVRLTAFFLIIYSILQKNLASRNEAEPHG